ncbi:DUF421 domain-containing protein [Flavihumibacter solisilvae]|nr:YetF domain-containing protein [Flavihumibacter solisilvae]
MKEIQYFDALPATIYMALIYFGATIISLGGLFLLNRIFRAAAYYNERFTKISHGEPTFLVLDGKPMLKNLRFEHMSLEDLNESLHQNGINEISLVKYVIKETNGQISIIKEDPAHTTTRENSKPSVALTA